MRVSALFFVLTFLTSCQIGYIAQSGYYQARMLSQRVPLHQALKSEGLSPDEKKKIKLAIEVRQFMRTDLNLKTDGHYSRFVQLDDDYVTYAVNAAEKNELKSYEWTFPIIGSVPYKAYFKKESALKEAKNLEDKNLDVHVRGVSAYSTLGWFEDPLLSSMLRMKEHQFVSLLIHETVHANLYIKSQSQFNERVASYLGQLGAEAYYQKLNRASELRETLDQEGHDELLFSEFISQEIKDLKKWYQDNKDDPQLLILREQKFLEIKNRFSHNYIPRFKTKNYVWFEKAKLNNAFLLLLNLYSSDFTDFEKLAQHYNRDFTQVFLALKSLEKEKNPESALKEKVASLNPTKQ